MNSLVGKHILVGISGGIAAYKSAHLVRLLVKTGAEVRVVMTVAATQFITPLTLQALSGHPVYQDLFEMDSQSAMDHIHLARWADLIVIAPASANIIAKLAHGEADDLLTTLCLASQAPIAICPAMNRVMWQQTMTQNNLAKLIHYQTWGPDNGVQACGENGPGRMLEPEDILQNIIQWFQSDELAGLRVLISAGATREKIDPVRFISNYSSGKMGFALAQAAMEAGASVTLVAGPCHLECADRIKRINIESSTELFSVLKAHMPEHDIYIGAAAVSDYRPATIAEQKIKKQQQEMQLNLIRNPDIISNLKQLFPDKIIIGFAAESQQVLTYGEKKLANKNLDMLIVNDISRDDIGFNQDDNEVVVLYANEKIKINKMTKSKLARRLLKLIKQKLLPVNVQV